MKNTIIKMLETELVWCKKNPTDQFSKDYQKGFIKGLRQSIFLIKKIPKSQLTDIWNKANKK